MPNANLITSGGSNFAQGAGKIGGAWGTAKKSKAEVDRTQEAYGISRDAYFDYDMSNPFSGMQSNWANATVNLEANRFEEQSNQSDFATAMAALGGSGTGAAAVNATAMLQLRGRQVAQRATRIGAQESAIQRGMAQGQDRMDLMGAQTDFKIQAANLDRLGTAFGMDQAAYAAASNAEMNRKQMLYTGWGEVVAGGLEVTAGLI